VEDRPMRKCWLVGTICIALFAFCGYSSLAQEAGGPRMVLKEWVFDFKEVKKGEIIRHTFQVLNEGDQTLEIKNVKPG